MTDLCPAFSTCCQGYDVFVFDTTMKLKNLEKELRIMQEKVTELLLSVLSDLYTHVYWLQFSFFIFICSVVYCQMCMVYLSELHALL